MTLPGLLKVSHQAWPGTGRVVPSSDILTRWPFCAWYKTTSTVGPSTALLDEPPSTGSLCTDFPALLVPIRAGGDPDGAAAHEHGAGGDGADGGLRDDRAAPLPTQRRGP